MRKYTVKELDDLRQACESRWLYGTTNFTKTIYSRQYVQNDMDKGVEELVRTYMMAGLIAEDIYAADNPPPVS